ncbi:Uncharacterized protein DAT39_022881, partial [Clarias magur]
HYGFHGNRESCARTRLTLRERFRIDAFLRRVIIARVMDLLRAEVKGRTPEPEQRRRSEVG